MNFFEHQAQAQRRTFALLCLFFFASVLLLVAVYVAVTVGIFAAQSFQGSMHDAWKIHDFWQKERFAWIALCTLSILCIGAWYKIHQLKQGGGAMLAEQLGGQRLPPNVQDTLLRRLLNVVEEMAIASGLPVPPVYLLNESGINAFAAGFTPSDAVIGVTQGAVDMLSRDELQAVIGHEFSHILHGDSRINMRMVGLLHGMTLISDLGSLLLTGRYHTHIPHRNRGTHPAIWVLGLLLFLVGLLGLIAADLIKLAVSRQREFLADASAVQFTRNPEAMARALMTIGGFKQGSHLNHQNAENLGYFFFSHVALKEKVRPPKQKDWWASHPPLLERIQRIAPSFRGRIVDVDSSKKHQRVNLEAQAGVHYAMPKQTQIAIKKDEVLASIGQMRASSLQEAQGQLQLISPKLRHLSHDPYAARGIAYAMLLSNEKVIRKQQWAYLEKKADRNVMRMMLDINHDMHVLPSHLRLPLLEMLMPALKSLSLVQYQQLVGNIRMLIKADHQISMFEYALHRMLLRHLKPVFEPVETVSVRFQNKQDVAASSACVLSVLITYGKHQDPKDLLAQVSQDLLGEAMPWPPKRLLGMKHWDAALSKLQQAKPDIKQALLKACVEVVFADGMLHEHELEALRAIADAMDCPMPMLANESTIERVQSKNL